MRGLSIVWLTQSPLRIWLLSAALAWVEAVPPAVAQTLPPSLDACSAQTDAGQRLACYDREVARLHQLQQGTSAAAATPPSPPPSVIPPAATYAPPNPNDPVAIDRFGLTPDMQHQRQEEGRAPQELTQITAHVTSVHYRPRGEIMVGLDNGQTWEQAEYDGDVSMSVGETVTIKAGALSAYYLKPHAGRIVRVRRIR